jgi:membrane protein DedA with SNARE-associated domain
MLESIIDIIKDVPWYWVIVIAFLMTFVENIFPPVPGDSVIVFTGAMASFGNVNFFLLLAFASIGSLLGFLTMYYLGFKFESSVIHSDKFKFISRQALFKVESWFKKYGYWLIVINRFIAGTRAAIAFFAGMSHLSVKITAVLSFISALIWNSILIYLGYAFGDNWQLINHYLGLYGKLFIPVLAAIVLFFAIRYFIKRKKSG